MEKSFFLLDRTERNSRMKFVLLIIGGIIMAGINFVMYCCLCVASHEDELLEQMEAARKTERAEQRW